MGLGSAARWLCGKSLPNLLMRFILPFDLKLLSVGTKSQSEDLGVEHTGSSAYLRPLSVKIVWWINDDNNQSV